MLYRSDSEMGAGDKVWVLMATFLSYVLDDRRGFNRRVVSVFRIAADATTVALWQV